MSKYIISFTIVFLHIFCFTQDSKSELLKKLNKLEKVNKMDSIYLNTLMNLGNIYKSSNFDSSIYFYKKSKDYIKKWQKNKNFSEFFVFRNLELERLLAIVYREKHDENQSDIHFKKGLKSLDSLKKNYKNNLPYELKKIEVAFYQTNGYFALNEGKLDEAQSNFEKALTLAEKINYSQAIAELNGNLGAVYINKSDFKSALKYLFKALKLNEKLKQETAICTNLGNIGIVYDYQGDYEKAIKYYKRALKIAQKKNLKSFEVNYLSNLGVAYMFSKQYEIALEYYDKSLKINKQLGNYDGQSADLSNIGTVYSIKKEHKKALAYFLEAYEISKKVVNKYNEAIFLNNIGTEYYNLNDLKNAEIYTLKSNQLSKEINSLELIKANHSALSDLYEKDRNYKDALSNYKKFILFRDSIYNEETTREGIEREIEFNYGKKATADSVAFAKEKEIQDAKLQVKKNQQYALFIGLALVLSFSFFIFKKYRETQKQKKIIENQKNEVELQKHLVEEKNQEILDSITYAKRIQSAILPQPKLVKQFLEDSFILYKPKDIVAGDFYWLEVVDDTVMFAAADCTGHGVPGAMVSVVCNNGLNRSVREFGLMNANEILDKTREIVLEEFEKSDEDVKDGMDISLCVLDTKTNILKWSGANNPLWIFRKNSSGETEFIETKADKQPIGKYSHATPFTQHEIQIKKNDIIYIFTDGYQDQFGGEKEKKFRVSQMKELFTSLSEKPMEEQRKIIDQSFQSWKGDLDQVDDVCIIGVRI
jgi:serine phosphatase RsbU (regulator of sigma subunit)/tetratricopeptide (TPR) repeat protein